MLLRALKYNSAKTYINSLSIQRPRNLFSAQQPKHNQLNQQSSLDQQKLQRHKDIQYRKRLLEQVELKQINNKIQNTKENFNPLFHYLKLYKSTFIIMAVVASFITFIVIFAKISGTFQHPLAKKKKFLLISDQFEKSLDNNLKECMINQIGKVQSISNHSQKQIEKLQQFLSATTKRTYKVVLVQGTDNIILMLPKTIIVSKSWLMSKNISEDELKDMILLMESLFVLKYHIRELNMAYMLTYLSYRFKTSSRNSIEMLNIYSRRYTTQEIKQTLEYITINYGPKDFTAIFSKLSTQNIKQAGLFCIRNRLQFKT